MFSKGYTSQTQNEPSLAKTAGIAFVLSLVILSASQAWAGGKKQTSPVAAAPSCPAAPVVAKPYRPVLMQLKDIKPFELPGHRQIDIFQDLSNMADTETGKTNTFTPAHLTSTPCSSHLELEISLGTLELGLTQFGLTIGYSPAGVATGIKTIEGNVDVDVSKISMEFAVNLCNINGCTQKISSSVTSKMVDTNTKITMNFGTINGALDFVTHPSINNLLRKMLAKGLSDMASNPKVNQLPWHATIREVNPAAGSLIFDAGTNQNLFPNQNFAVYAVNPTQGECNVYKVLAYTHTLRVDLVSSLAVIDAVLDSRNIQEGDIVMIKP